MFKNKPLVKLNDFQEIMHDEADGDVTQTLSICTGTDCDVHVQTTHAEMHEPLIFNKPAPDAMEGSVYQALELLFEAMKEDNRKSNHMGSSCEQDEFQSRIHDDCEGNYDQVLAIAKDVGGKIKILAKSRGGFENLRFRIPVFGGGMSENTYHALVNLMNVMRTKA
ncbi:hypothetical protein [Vibrio harveyi]|uniref:hypothetical protein n=1 Tax=Vibrio harveyi TaxID=669 RepID=UPI003CEFE9A4